MAEVTEDAELRRLASRIATRLEVERPDDPEEEWFTAEHHILPGEFAALASKPPNTNAER